MEIVGLELKSKEMAYKPGIVVVHGLSVSLLFLLVANVGQHVFMKINVYFSWHDLLVIHYTHKIVFSWSSVDLNLPCNFLFFITVSHLTAFTQTKSPSRASLTYIISAESLFISPASPRRCGGSSGLLSSCSEHSGSYWADPEPPRCR